MFDEPNNSAIVHTPSQNSFFEYELEVSEAEQMFNCSGKISGELLDEFTLNRLK